MTEQVPFQTDYQPAKLSARDFLMLSDAGAFDSYARSELIEGEIWVVNAIHSWHAKTLGEVGFELRLALNAVGSALVVYHAGSIAMAEDSVPEPDLAVGNDNTDGILPLAKTKLAIEISDTTIATDLGRKAALYARHRVPEYWVIDRDGGCVHQMWSPQNDGYRERRSVVFGEPISAASIAGVQVTMPSSCSR